MRLLPLILLSVVLTPVLAAEPKVFTEERIHVFHLTVQKGDFDAMKPTRRGFLSYMLGGSNPATTRPSTRPATQPAVERLAPNPFGLMHAYVRGQFEYEGQAIKDVAVRYKGNSSYSSAGGMNRPYKIDFDRFVDGQTFQGLGKLNFHNASFDPSMLRERLSYELFSAAGVPSPRTGLGVLYLTVPGRHARTPLGLYTLVEEVNKPFLREHFKSDKGLLLKPENAFNFVYLDDEWLPYTVRFEPLSGDTPQNTKRFIAFLRLIHKADDATFAKEIEQRLDVDAFLRFLAVHALLSHMDSLLMTGHNFYIYVHPDTGRVHMIPWDLNLSFGSFGWTGSTNQLINLSIDEPYSKPNRLLERVLAIPAYKQRYRAIVRELIDGPLSPPRVSKRVDELNGLMEQARKLPGNPTTRPSQAWGEEFKAPDLKYFITARVASVKRQLDGKETGYVPSIRIKRILGMEKDDQ